MDYIEEDYKKLTRYDELLQNIDYNNLYKDGEHPTEFALKFVLFIKLVNDGIELENKTPNVHMKMLDKLAFAKRESQLNICWRGASKTSLFCEYLPMYVAIYRSVGLIKDIGDMILIFNSEDNGARPARRALEALYNRSKFLQSMLPQTNNTKFTDNFIRLSNREGKSFTIKLLGYQQPIRGSKNEEAIRPKLIVIDDIFTNKSARSDTSREIIKSYIDSDVRFALHPKEHLLIYNATPFKKDDPAIEYCNTGKWNSSVFPVCNKFPCPKEEFVSGWPDRFTYEYVKEMYDLVGNSAKDIESFMREMMLSVINNESKYIKTGMINTYNRKDLINRLEYYNCYIVSDLSYSTAKKSDYTCIIPFAVDNIGQIFILNGFARRSVGTSVGIDKLFEFNDDYYPYMKGTGLETNGVQLGIVHSIQKEMKLRNKPFTIARSKIDNKLGIQSSGDKLTRFLTYGYHFFTNYKIFFPDDLMETEDFKEIIEQLDGLTYSGIKGKDDCIDAFSQMGMIKITLPSRNPALNKNISKNHFNNSIYPNSIFMQNNDIDDLNDNSLFF